MRSASFPAECSTEACAVIAFASSATHHRECKGSDSAVGSVDPALGVKLPGPAQLAGLGGGVTGGVDSRLCRLGRFCVCGHELGRESETLCRG